MTLLAAAATVATAAPYSDIESAELPGQAVTLTPTAPEWRKRFEVESGQAYFSLTLEFVSTPPVLPRIELTPIEQRAGSFKILDDDVQFDRRENSDSDDRVSAEYRIGVDCPEGSPCESQFEVLLTAVAAATSTVEGSLSLSVMSCDENYDCYAAIRPL